MTLRLHFAILALLIVLSVPARAADVPEQLMWTVNEIPDARYTSKDVALEAMHELGDLYEKATVLTSTETSAQSTTYWYGVEPVEGTKEKRYAALFSDPFFYVGPLVLVIPEFIYESEADAKSAEEYWSASHWPGSAPCAMPPVTWGEWEPFTLVPDPRSIRQRTLSLPIYSYYPESPELGCSFYGEYALPSVLETEVLICPEGYHEKEGMCRNDQVASITSSPETSCTKVGNPINAATGDKMQSETDLVLPWITFTRHYHSRYETPYGGFGNGWTNSLNVRLSTNYALTTETGHQVAFVQTSSGVYAPVDCSNQIMTFDGSGNPTIRDESGVARTFASGRITEERRPDGRSLVYAYDTSGRLTSVTHSSGRRLVLEYVSGFASASNKVARIRNQTGTVLVSYTYGSTGNLLAVSKADGTQRSYKYENNAFPAYLTGIVDENSVRYATFGYDNNGLANYSGHVGGADSVSVAYSNTSSTITDGRNVQSSFTFSNDGYFRKPTQATRPTGTISVAWAPYVSDPRRRPTSNTNNNGVTTTYAYSQYTDGGGRLRDVVVETQATGTAIARTVQTERDAHTAQILLKQESGRTTAYQYNDRGQLLSQLVTDTTLNKTLQWSYEYCEAITTACPRVGLLHSKSEPSTGVTTYGYDSNGDLWSITNAAGQTSTVLLVSDSGAPLEIVDPNGVHTVFTYDAMDRMLSSAIAGNTTSYSYDDIGQLERITAPDGSFTSYAYDSSHRLTEISDTQGNRIRYTLDTMGNRTKTETFDPSSNLRRTAAHTFDAMSRVSSISGANGQLKQFDYDGNGNVTAVTDAGAYSTLVQYDQLDRTKSISDPASGASQYAYNALGQVTSVTDPRSIVTSYNVNSFGALSQITSADSGTSTLQYDTNGRRTSKTDANGTTVTYQYDALGRVTKEEYPSSFYWNTTTYFYDGTNYTNGAGNGVGRLTGTQTPLETITLYYDAQGNLAQRTSTVGTALSTWYTYDAANRITKITYPTGRNVFYDRDVAGNVTRIRQNYGSTTTTVADSIQYVPFGPVKSMTLGNGVSAASTYDLDYRTSGIQHGAVLSRSYTYNTRNAVTNIADAINTNRSQAFSYDSAGRLLSATGLYGSLAWTYDANGNRRSENRNGSASTYNYASSNNRLTSITGFGAVAMSYDAAGNQLTKGSAAFAYDGQQRLNYVGQSGTALSQFNVYDYDGLRTSVQEGGVTRRFIYDQKGHLLAEVRANLQVVAEYIWLEDRPIAMIASRTGSTTKEIFYYHNDHLNAPQKMTDATGAVVWDAPAEPFGKAYPLVQLVQNNLRLPGQYNNVYTGLHQNWKRDYDPLTGRYIESDPVGLSAGLNVYGYVQGDPINYVDPTGLTRADINNLTELARRTQPDLQIPDRVHTMPMFPGGLGVTVPYLDTIFVNNKYLDKLDHAGRKELLELIIHESIHATRPALDSILHPLSHEDIYTAAAERLKKIDEKYY